MSQPPADIPIKKRIFYEDQLVVVASPKMNFQRKERQLHDLADNDWIIREQGSGTRIVMKKLFKKYKMSPSTAMEVGNNESIKQLIIANMGISIVSRQSIELELKHNLVRVLPITGFPLKHPWYFVMSKGKHVSPVVSEFLAYVKAQSDYT